MGYLIKRRLLLLVALDITISALAQTKAASPDAVPTPNIDIRAQELELYGSASPYVDPGESLGELEKIVPGLRGLKVASSQEPLGSILAGVGTNVNQMLHQVPNLMSDETVGESVSRENPDVGFISSQNQRGRSARVAGPASHNELTVRNFEYIVLVHQTASERMLEEYRTDRQGKMVTPGAAGPSSIGFVSLWVAFSPSNRDKTRFEYLGEEQIEGRNIFVVAFAQLPGMEEHPGTIVLPDGRSFPMLCQGVAWIDESDFRILRMRTDLLAPLPQANLQQVTGLIQFGAVKIAKLEAELWLPREVKLKLKAEGLVVQELHQYSKYRLYKAKAKIVAGPS